MSDENDSSNDDARDVLDAVGDGAEAASDTAALVSDIADGDAAGAVSNAAGAASGALGVAEAALGGPASEVGSSMNEARQAAETAGQVVGAVSSGLDAAGRLFGGGSDHDPSRYVVPEGQVPDALADSAAALDDVLGGGGANLGYHLTVDGADVVWAVLGVRIEEGVGRLSECFIDAQCEPDAIVEEVELFGKDVHLTLERGESQRNFRGVVRSGFLTNGREAQLVHLEVVPALWMLEQTRDSRIYQDISVPDLVFKVLQELLGSRHREVRKELADEYPRHEYLVQHRESHFAFLSRLCDEEGIWFYFDHEEGEHEVLVLADSNENRPQLENGNGGQVEFSEQSEAASRQEVAVSVTRRRHLGPTDVVVSGYDWSNPTLPVKQEHTDRGDHQGPPLEVHEHHHAVRHHEYDDGGGQYQSHTAEREGRMHTERLDVTRAQWSMETSVLGARPGVVFELVNSGDHDERYLVLSSSISGSGNGQHGAAGGFSNHLEVLPVDVPYRPPAPAPRVVSGPETAMVVGPAGEEIHTDQHGRVKVQFHWDRRGQKNEHSSAWIRVAQMWTGPGWGTVFIPRIGTEVIITYLGGDPDRPVVTGCLYNGDHRLPYSLPDEKTKSTIKTNSSPGGGGYNELRFEDKAGSEEVFLHAQKDFNEVVENNHSTHVKANQTNTVDVDQTETIHGEQTMTVDKNRTVTVTGSQSFKIEGSEANDGITGSKLDITGDYQVDVSDWIKVTAPTYIELNCGESKIRMEPGKITFHAGQGAEIVLDANAKTTSNAGTEQLLDADARTTASTGAELKLTSDADLKSIAGSRVLLDVSALMTSSKAAVVELNADANMSGDNAQVAGRQTAEVTAPTATLAGAGGSVEAAASGVDVAGPTVNVSGQSMVNISGSVVKIN